MVKNDRKQEVSDMDIDVRAEGGHIERKSISKSASDIINNDKLNKV